MTTRSLSLLVLSLVLGTALMVGWYLEGGRPVSAAERAPDAHPRVEHVWRTYPGAVSKRRSRGRSNRLTSIRFQGQVSPGQVPTRVTPAPSTGTGTGTDESTAYRPYRAD